MKLKEQLVEIGLTEETAQKVMDEVVGKNYVPKSRFNEVNEENKTLKKSVADYDKQFEDLKKSSGDNTALQQQIAELQRQNNDQKKAHEAEMAQLRLDNAIDSALTSAGAKNVKAVKPFIDATKVKLDEDGKLTGLDEQLKEVQKTEGYLFAEKQQTKQQTFRGFQPGASGDVKPGTEVDTSKMTYSELAAYMAANPDAKID